MKKTFQLLIATLLLATSATAQRYRGNARSEKYAPTVYLVSAREVDTVYECCGAAQRLAAMNQAAVDNAINDYMETHRTGFQQAEKPQFVFTTRNNRFSFSLGGSIALRGSYDFKGVVDNTDFVPYDIPVPGNYATRQKISMDASTSRLFMKAIAHSGALGRVVIFIDADFRGGAPGSYTPRLRSAYVSALGFTLGRDVTTFCDLQAAPTTIDFQGPNAYNFNFATVARYEVDFARDHMRFGVACELPNVSGTYNDYFAPIPQRMPDFPMYLQYAWGADRSSHIRATGVIRNLYMHNLRTGNNTSRLGWGAQLSGTIRMGRPFRLFFNGVYGEGITPYIQDLTGSGLDFAPDPENPAKMQTMPMWGWQAALQINLSKRLFVTGGYSTVHVEKENGYISANEYSQGQYIFGNIFYALTPRCRIAAEYLRGSRENMDGIEGTANRMNLLVQYNF